MTPPIISGRRDSFPPIFIALFREKSAGGLDLDSILLQNVAWLKFRGRLYGLSNSNSKDGAGIMKLTGGMWRNRKISGRGLVWEHTSDETRKDLFNALGTWIEGQVMLDAFAGSGCVGFDALSRGVDNVTFLDASRGCCTLIEKNAALLRVSKGVFKILKVDLEEACLSVLGVKAFSFVFLDPPYDTGLVERGLRALVSCKTLRRGAIVVAKHWVGERLAVKLLNLKRFKMVKYGDTFLSYYKHDKP